jgi:hypothetical protein
MSAPAASDTRQAGADSRVPGPARGSVSTSAPPRWAPSAMRGPVITGAGALLTAGMVAAAMVSGSVASNGAATSGEPTLSALAAGEIAAASVTLDPATSASAVAEAKSCKAPLASVTLVKAPGSPSGTVRIRSGGYLSPAFHVTEAPQRVAIPFPAAYPTGRGVLSVVGASAGLSIYLTPGWSVQGLNGAASTHVVWTPGNPC